MDILEELEKSKRNKSGKVCFLYYLDQIKKAISAGYSKKDIWNLLVEKDLIDTSYSQFARYCKDYLNEENNPVSAKGSTTQRPVVKDDSGIQKFKWDSNIGDVKDLI